MLHGGYAHLYGIETWYLGVKIIWEHLQIIEGFSITELSSRGRLNLQLQPINLN